MSFATAYFTTSVVTFVGLVVWAGYSANWEQKQTISNVIASPEIIVANFFYCMLFFVGKLLQKLLFGPLRIHEAQCLREQIVSNATLKIIFLFILSTTLPKLTLWACAIIFGLSEFISAFTLLAKERGIYIRLSQPNIDIFSMDYVLVANLLVTCLLYAGVVTIFASVNANTVLILVSFECFVLFCKTLQPLLQSGIALEERRRHGVWEQKGVYTYYVDMFMDCGVLIATLGYYFYILAIRGLSLSIVDFCLFSHIWKVICRLKFRWVSFRNYRQLVANMNSLFLVISGPDVFSDVCAICQEAMLSACKLPCSHLFHRMCLMRWLEQEHTCPTCRRVLLGHPHPVAPTVVLTGPGAVPLPAGHIPPPPAAAAPPPINRPPAVWEWNSGGWMNVFPRISIQAIHGNGFPMYNSRTMNVVTPDMIQRVLEVFPHMPPQLIAADLQMTGSCEATTENILEGRLTAPEPTYLNTQPPSHTPTFHVNSTAQSHTDPPTPEVTHTSTTLSSSSHSSISSLPATPSTSTSSSSQQTEPSSPVPFTQSTPLSDPHPVFRSDFSSSPQQRQASLAARKQAILEEARRRYLEAKKKPGS